MSKTTAENVAYKYKPLKPNQVRLFKFLQDGDHTHVVLGAFSINTPLPAYRSLSYTWAPDERVPPQRSWEIKIHNQTLPVLSTLRPFFEALRSRNMLLDGKWWWIDSICIDQESLQERANQVQQMDIIYRQAESAIVWLGEASSDSALALDFIRLLDKTSRRKLSLQDLRATLQQEHYRAHWTALANFLSRRWWTRIWSVQEFVLASSVSMWCGARSVSRVAMCRSISMADKCTAIGIKQTLAFPQANNRRRAWGLYKLSQRPDGPGVTFSLLALAAYFCCMDASDERDRLYGLMALATDRALLAVDYALTTEEVYARFTRAFITHYQSLDIICFAATYASPPGTVRPSWVPGWQKRNPQVIPSLTSQSAKMHVGNLRSPGDIAFDPSVYYAACKNKEAVYAFEGSTLKVRGVIVDAIDGLAGSRGFPMSQSSEWNSTQSSCCSSSSGSTRVILESVCRSLAFDRCDRFLRYPMPAEEFFGDFIQLLDRIVNASGEGVPQELVDWLQWTRCLQIHGRSFEDLLQDMLQAGEYFSGPAPNVDEYLQNTFFGRFFDTVVRLSFRLVVSRAGRIGMTVEKAIKGDIVCVLYGCSVPVVLRKATHGDGYTLVGECYLDGCMDGSLLDDDGLAERTFVLQ